LCRHINVYKHNIIHLAAFRFPPLPPDHPKFIPVFILKFKPSSRRKVVCNRLQIHVTQAHGFNKLTYSLCEMT
jgi:hypothetical protein